MRRFSSGASSLRLFVFEEHSLLCKSNAGKAHSLVSKLHVLLRRRVVGTRDSDALASGRRPDRAAVYHSDRKGKAKPRTHDHTPLIKIRLTLCEVSPGDLPLPLTHTTRGGGDDQT